MNVLRKVIFAVSSTTMDNSDDELVEHEDGDSIDLENEKEADLIEPTNSWRTSAILIVGATAGVGVLGLPQAVAKSGWIGIVLLLLCGAMSRTTSHTFLGKLLDHTRFNHTGHLASGVLDYATLGEVAFGHTGKVATLISQNITLAGSVVIYLVVLGQLCNGLFPRISSGWFTLVSSGMLTLFVIARKDMRKMKWVGYVAVATTCVMVLCLLGILWGQKETTVSETKIVKWDTLFISLSVFTFAFGGHSIQTSIYTAGRGYKDWRRASNVGYVFTILLLYLPLSYFSYEVLGETLLEADTIFDLFSQSEETASSMYFQMGSISIIIHIMMALPMLAIHMLQCI